jgi:prevent-host-death family protein
LASDAASVLRQVKESRRPTVITQEGRPEAVLLSIDAYQQAQAEREILTRLAQGEREIAQGEGFSLDDVLSHADSLLRRS